MCDDLNELVDGFMFGDGFSPASVLGVIVPWGSVVNGVSDVLTSGNAIVGGRAQSQRWRTLLHAQVPWLRAAQVEDGSERGELTAPQHKLSSGDSEVVGGRGSGRRRRRRRREGSGTAAYH